MILRNNSGFTLIEVAVVATITGIITTFMIINFQRSRVDIVLTSSEMITDLRKTQTNASASTRYNNAIRCGYGIRYVNPTSYAMYVGPDAGTVDCSAQNRNFGPEDSIVLTKEFSEPRVEFSSPFPDIFFEPPDPKTFLDNISTPGLSQTITIQKIGGTCPQDCKTINVNTSGKIE